MLLLAPTLVVDFLFRAELQVLHIEMKESDLFKKNEEIRLEEVFSIIWKNEIFSISKYEKFHSQICL